MSLELYTRFQATFEHVPPTGPPAPYDWLILPNPMGAEALVYGHMAPEFARELANGLNQLSRDVRRLRAWAIVCDGLTNTQKFEASGEFIEPLATFALNAPYALNAKFAFAAAHLCHQANAVRLNDTWSDDLPEDHDITWKTAD